VLEGNYDVVATGHTLVLNWNAQLVPLLRQLRFIQRERGLLTGKHGNVRVGGLAYD
jgi:hypothetical protein